MNKKNNALVIVDVLLLLSLVIIPFYWIFDPTGWFPKLKYIPFLLIPLFIGLRLLIPLFVGLPEVIPIYKKISGLWEKDLFKKLCLFFGVPFFLLFTCEALLRVKGFHYELSPIIIKSDSNKKHPRSGIIPDAELKWAYNPGTSFGHGSAKRPVNSMGFLDREVDPVKKPNSKRVISLGDSCTAQGIPTYAGFLHEHLTAKPITDTYWEAFNMGVHGYSSTQGLKQFILYGKNLKPDYVTIYFGWNDHWRGTTSDEYNIRGTKKSGPLWYGIKKLREKLFFQYMIKQVADRAVKQTRDKDNFVLRVPAEGYEKNLRNFVKEIRSVQATPIFFTAPRDKKLTPLLIKNKQASSLELAIQYHDQYNEIVRKVAKEENVPLIDFQQKFIDEDLFHFFSNDGIHLTREGRQYIAQTIYDYLTELEAN